MDTTWISASRRFSRRMRSISSPVPTGTVDLVITTAVPDKQRRDLAHRLVDEAQIGVAVATARRRADGDEHGVGLADGRRVGGEVQTLLPDIGLNQIGKARLEDRNFAVIERRDFLRILVDAGHVMTEIGKAGAGHQPHISGADHRHAHRRSPIKSRPAPRPAPTCLRTHQRRRRRIVRPLAHQRKPAPPEQHR